MTDPLAVDRHLCMSVNAQMLDLRDVADSFHVCCIAARAEYACDARLWVDVVRGDERARRVACQGDDFGRYRLTQHVRTGFAHTHTSEFL